MHKIHRLCHFLIGIPSSGKSTLAKKLLQIDTNAVVVSTDAIRALLFGDESIQGDWLLIESEVFKQIELAVSLGKSVIYDATNAKQEWRLSMLEKLGRYKNLQWIGWHVKTPLSTCLAWNRQRNRQVPEEIIEKMDMFLRENPPTLAEGFAAVYRLNLAEDNWDAELMEFWQKLSL
ncbi:MAG: ATP-binding protein [Coleofasciculaceae cyanobacterium]